MTRYLVKRVLLSIPTVFGVLCIVFFILHILPGDPVDIMLGETAQSAEKEILRQKLNLDRSLPDRFLIYLSDLAKGDLGESIWSKEPVSRIVRGAFLATLQLAFSAFLISILIAVPGGLWAAAKNGKFPDRFILFFSLLLFSFPAFWLGPVLIYVFAFQLDLFPISGQADWNSIFLPAITLGTGMAALTARMTKASAVEVLREDFIRTVRAKGGSTYLIWGKHVLKNVALPLITVLGLQMGSLLAGSVITEKVFSWPGLGLTLISAIEKRDYPVVQGSVLLISFSYVLINLFTDLVYGWIDPRIRVDRGGTI